MSVATLADWIADVLIVVLVIGIPAIWLTLPRHNGELTHAFRMMFAGFSLIMFRSAAYRLDLWQVFGASTTAEAVVSGIVFAYTIAAVPRCVLASYRARKTHRTALSDLAARAAVLAHETQTAAQEVHEAAAQADVPRDANHPPFSR